MPSGGYRKPKGAQPASGPGKFSKRTDAQAVQTPKLSGSDLQSGDVGMLQNAQKIAPLPQGVNRPALGQQRQLQGSPLQGGKLPPYLFDTPTALPGTPDTSGLSSGAGPGPESLDSAIPPDDVREKVMDYIFRTFDNKDAEQWLIDYRNERAAASQPPMGVPPTTAPLTQEPVTQGAAPVV